MGGLYCFQQFSGNFTDGSKQDNTTDLCQVTDKLH